MSTTQTTTQPHRLPHGILLVPPPDVTVWLEDNSGSPMDLLFPPFAGEDYDSDIYMRQVYSDLVTEDNLT